MPAYSYWERAVLERKRDFSVIGAGLVGLTTAILLKRRYPRASVAVFERAPMAAGATTRNAGFACFGMPGELTDDLETLGEAAMLRLVEMRYKGFQRLLNLHGTEKLNFSQCGGYEVFFPADQLSLEKLTENVGRLNQIMKQGDLPAAFRFAHVPNPGNSHFLNSCIGAFHQPLEGTLNSGLLWESLQDLCRQEGVEIFYGIQITGSEECESGQYLSANNDLQLYAGKVVICTNGFTASLLPELGEEVKPARGQILVATVNEGSLPAGAFHYRRGYVYFRKLDETTLLIGGGRDRAFEEEETESQETSNLIIQELEHLLSHEILSAPFWVSSQWAGTMGVGPKRLPLLMPYGKNTVLAVRMGGMGVALGTLMAEEAVALFE